MSGKDSQNKLRSSAYGARKFGNNKVAVKRHESIEDEGDNI